MAVDLNTTPNEVAPSVASSYPWYESHVPLGGFCSVRMARSTAEDSGVKVEVELDASFLTAEEADQLVVVWPQAVRQLLLLGNLQPGQSSYEISLDWGGLVLRKNESEDDQLNAD